MDFLLRTIGCSKKEREMHSKKLLFTGFILVALIQLAIPANMIWHKERVLATGKEFKFETTPIDPTDPFRGKYITLGYLENSFEIEDKSEWKEGEKVFVILENDDRGLAKIKSVSKEKPNESTDFLKTEVAFVSGNFTKQIHFTFPFDRYYMEESKAYEAEQIYLENQVDTTKTTYALVLIKNGDAVLKDVLIDGVPIRDMDKKIRNMNP